MILFVVCNVNVYAILFGIRLSLSLWTGCCDCWLSMPQTLSVPVFPTLPVLFVSLSPVHRRPRVWKFMPWLRLPFNYKFYYDWYDRISDFLLPTTSLDGICNLCENEFRRAGIMFPNLTKNNVLTIECKVFRVTELLLIWLWRSRLNSHCQLFWL